MNVLYIDHNDLQEREYAVSELLNSHNINHEPVISLLTQKESLLLDGKVKKSINIGEFDLIVIEESLNWDESEIDDYYGYELAEVLRKNYINQSIIIATNESSHAQRSHNLKFEIIKTPGHILWDYDKNKTNKSIEPHLRLTNEAIEDILYSVFDIKGSLEEIFHTLKHDISAKNQINWFFLKERIQRLFEKNPFHKNFEENKLDQLIDAGMENPTGKSIDSIKEDLIQYFESVDDDIKQDKEPWKVLLVDDESNTRKKYQRIIEESGIACEVAASGNEAIEILRNDSLNDITVMISDYRFFKDGEKNWQSMQGYDIIKYAYENVDNALSYFLLTSKRSAIMRYARSGGTPFIQCYEKGNLTESLNYQQAVKVFLDSIRNEGNRVYSSLVNQPSLKSWTTSCNKVYDGSPLNKYYRKYIESRSLFNQYENEINSEINNLIENFLKKGEQRSEKNLFYNFVNLLDIKDTSLTGDISYPANSEKGIKQFAWSVMFPRRFALSVYLSIYREREQLYATNYKREYVVKQSNKIAMYMLCNFRELKKNSISQVLNTKLSLKKNFEALIRGQLLKPEENYFKSKNWI